MGDQKGWYSTMPEAGISQKHYQQCGIVLQVLCGRALISGLPVQITTVSQNAVDGIEVTKIEVTKIVTDFCRCNLLYRHRLKSCRQNNPIVLNPTSPPPLSFTIVTKMAVLGHLITVVFLPGILFSHCRLKDNSKKH